MSAYALTPAERTKLLSDGAMILPPPMSYEERELMILKTKTAISRKRYKAKQQAKSPSHV